MKTVDLQFIQTSFPLPNERSGNLFLYRRQIRNERKKILHRLLVLLWCTFNYYQTLS